MNLGNPCSTETHHVVGRALGVLGLGRRSLREVALDRRGTIDLHKLQAALDQDAAAGRTQVAIVGCAGDVNTGRVDPIAELARIARERGIWLHVDGAYGGWGVLDVRVRDRFGDVATYDSRARHGPCVKRQEMVAPEPQPRRDLLRVFARGPVRGNRSSGVLPGSRGCGDERRPDFSVH